MEKKKDAVNIKYIFFFWWTNKLLSFKFLQFSYISYSFLCELKREGGRFINRPWWPICSLRFKFCYSYRGWNDWKNKENFDAVSSWEKHEVWPIYKTVQYFVSPYTSAEQAETKFHSLYRPYYVNKRGQPAKLWFYRRRKIMAEFYTCCILWEVGYLPPILVIL